MTQLFPTVREVLALDPVRGGVPRVVAGEQLLDRPVRWVHSAEVPDIASLLRGGELVLTTGIGLPAGDPALRAFVAELAEVGVVGLFVELGRRFSGSLPKPMVAAAARHGLVLVELRRATPFVQITEAVHAMIVDAQLGELRATEEIHQRFTELSVEGAEPAEVVAQAAALAGAPVVLENLSRRVLAYDAAGERADLLLDGWEAHSRRIAPGARTGYDPDSGWLVTMVGARGQDWGRLLLRWPAGEPSTRLVILVERAASALALGRLIRRDAEGLERQIHGTVLTALLEHSRPVDEVVLRAKALGVPLERRRLVGVVVLARVPDDPLPARDERLRDVAEAVAQALRDARLQGLVSALDEHSVGALLTLRTGAAEDAPLARFATALRRLRSGLLIAAGSVVDSPREARRSLVEARQVAYAARADTRDVPVFRLPDVGLAGLLHLLRDEPRVQTFVERELGPLLAYDAKHPREQLLGSLRAYLASGRNKSAAAAAAHLSRPAFYERLARIGRILDRDLDAVDACLSLHVALLALDAIRDT
ncbi:MAG TPA: PucR family transcriptional regulator ligand-binding domain-containing protein [Rugosimonospora sp.]|nr:PucR family transcriptional regulator ligand-binding domain-containing protein [Rugosimonospora sp.]